MKFIDRRCILLLCAVAILLVGCGSSAQVESEQRDDRLNVVTTLFPYYDFIKQIAGEQVATTLVVPAGMDSHSFEPTPADMKTIQNADILICNGGEMEHWLEAVLDTIDTSEITVVQMMDYVTLLESKVVEGMEADDHDHTKNHTGHEELLAYEEHIWTSPVNAIKLVEEIREVLAGQDPAYADQYQRQAGEYIKELVQLDYEFRQLFENRKRNVIVVGDKFPFRYLAEEYGLEYRAAFSGCSSDTEPSAKTIAYLIDKVREEQLPAVYYLELSSQRVSEIIGEETGAKPLLLHSCHSVTRAQFDEGITYLKLMEQNIENLREGLVQ